MNRFFVLSVLLTDLAAILLAFLVAYWLRFDSGLMPPAVRHGLFAYLPVLAINLVRSPFGSARATLQ